MLVAFNHYLQHYFYSVYRHVVFKDEVAEWLRRWTANPLCSARVGSNPTLVAFFFFPPQSSVHWIIMLQHRFTSALNDQDFFFFFQSLALK